MDAQGPVGYYGKFPGRGDFISRRVSREFIDFWDNWLQNALSCSHTQLHDAWLNVYLTSPIWRFILSPGMCGRDIWMGVIMPSVDKVGRYFPLTIVSPLSESVNPFNVVSQASNWFTQAEEVALSTLEQQNFDVEAFDAKVEALDALLPNIIVGESQNMASGLNNLKTSRGLRLPITHTNVVDRSYSSLLWQLMNNRYSTFSLWWSDGSEHVEPSLLVSDGLPSVEAYAALLDGKWQQWSWDNCPVQFMPEVPDYNLSQVAQSTDEHIELHQVPLVAGSQDKSWPEIKDDWWADESRQAMENAETQLYGASSTHIPLEFDTLQLLIPEALAEPSSDLAPSGAEKTSHYSLAQQTAVEPNILAIDETTVDPLAKTMLIQNPASGQKLSSDVQKPLGVLGYGSKKSAAENELNIETEDGCVNSQNIDRDPDTLDQPSTETNSVSTDQDGNAYSYFKWVSAALSHPGRVREINEDAFLDFPQLGIWVVADGVGGHSSGDLASRAIVQQLEAIDTPDNLEQFITQVKSSLHSVNRYLFENLSNSEENMIGSTVAILVVFGKQAACIWAGDSRIYLNRQGTTSRLTKDHSVEEEEAENTVAPSLTTNVSNIITRAVGADGQLELDEKILDLQADDVFLLCSDGLYKEVTEEEIGEYLNREDCMVMTEGLLNLALSRNARDNVTVISVMIKNTN